MGHIRLGRMPQSRKWRAIMELLEAGAPSDEIAALSSEAARDALTQAARDPLFLAIVELLAHLPHEARGPGYVESMENRGLTELYSVAGILAGLTDWIDSESLRLGHRSDVGEIAQSAFISALSKELALSLPGLFEPTPGEIRKALGQLSSGDRFGRLARRFFAGVVERTLDYYLSREFANHVGPGHRFSTDAERATFDRELSRHAYEAARNVETYAGGWYGKSLWQGGGLTRERIKNFASYSMTKLRRELAQRDHDA